MDWQFIPQLVGIGLFSFALSFIGAIGGLVLGHLRLPLLLALLPSAATAVATNSLISGMGAVAGSIRHIRDGRVSWDCVWLMGSSSIFGASIGAFVVLTLPFTWALVVIGTLLVVTGYHLQASSHQQPRLIRWPRWLVRCVEFVLGLLLGLLGAITGLMLGSLRLPLMKRLLDDEVKKLIGSNMLIGCMTALSAALTSCLAGGGPSLIALVVIVPPTMLGTYLGSAWVGRLSKETVQRFAGWVIAATGLIMLVQGLTMYSNRPLTGLPNLADAARGDGTEEAEPKHAQGQEAR